MLFIPSHSCFLSVKSVPLFEKIAHFREDLFPRKKTQHEGIRKDLCPQMTQMHAVEFRVPLFPICVHLRYLRAIPDSVAAGRAGSSVVHFFPVAVVKSLPSGTVPIRANQGAIRANQG
jgi:hypothetical protein